MPITALYNNLFLMKIMPILQTKQDCVRLIKLLDNAAFKKIHIKFQNVINNHQ